MLCPDAGGDMNFALPVGSLEKSIPLLIVFLDLVRRKKKSHKESTIKEKEKKKDALFEIRVFILSTASTMKQISYTRNSLAVERSTHCCHCGHFIVGSFSYCKNWPIYLQQHNIFVPVSFFCVCSWCEIYSISALLPWNIQSLTYSFITCDSPILLVFCVVFSVPWADMSLVIQ